jgi:hypothetical protein
MGTLMRCVRVCVAATVVAGLAIGGPQPSIANIDPEPALVQDSDDDDDEETEESTESKPSDETSAQHTRIDSAAVSLDPDVVAEHALFFSGADIWRNGLFSHSGLFWAYRGLNADGPVLKLLMNAGLYRYQSGRKQITGFQTMGAALPGWRWHWPGLEVTLFAGLDVQDHRFLPDDRGNRLRARTSASAAASISGTSRCATECSARPPHYPQSVPATGPALQQAGGSGT